MQKGQFDVNVRGEINLKANGQSINLLNELQSNPTLVRAITDLISDSISKKTHGNRHLTDIFLEAFWLSFRSSESGQFTFGYWNDRLTLPLGLIISA